MDSTHAQHLSEGWSEGSERLRLLALFVLSALCFQGSGCGGRTERPGVPPRHVLLITCERARADHFTGFGYDRESTGVVMMDQPYVLDFDYLGQSGVTFANAMAPSSDDRVSIASLLTGALPVTEGRLNVEGAPSEEMATLAEDFTALGYQTSAFVNGSSLSPAQTTADGFGRGFAHAEFSSTDESMLTAAVTWLGQNATRETPNFVWLHLAGIQVPFEGKPLLDQLSDPTYSGAVRPEMAFFEELSHGTLELDRADRHRLRDHYDGRLLHVTRLMKSFFFLYRSTFAQGNLWNDTLIVFVGTSGCELAEQDGRVANRDSLVDAGLRVPLQFWHPPSMTGERILQPVVSLTDVHATLRDWFQLAHRAQVEGDSLLALTDSFAPREFNERSGLSLARLASGELGASLRTRQWRFLRDGEEKLYDVTVDFKNRHNIARDLPDVVEKLRAELMQRVGELGLATPALPNENDTDGVGNE